MSNLAEQLVSPRDLSAEHYYLIDEIEKVEAELIKIGLAQDAWTDFDHAFTDLDTPPEIVAAWDKILPWLSSLAGATQIEMETLQEAEQDLLF